LAKSTAKQNFLKTNPTRSHTFHKIFTRPLRDAACI